MNEIVWESMWNYFMLRFDCVNERERKRERERERERRWFSEINFTSLLRLINPILINTIPVEIYIG